MMNKIKEEKKFQYLNTTHKLTPTKLKTYQFEREKTSSSKKYTESLCKQCRQYTKKQQKWTETIEDKQKSMSKCLEFIDQLMDEVNTLRNWRRSNEKKEKRRYTYKTEQDRGGYSASISPIRQTETLKKQVKSIRNQRDKLFLLIKDLQNQNNKLVKEREQTTVSYSQIINSFKHQKQSYISPIKPLNNTIISTQKNQHPINFSSLINNQSNNKQKFISPFRFKDTEIDRQVVEALAGSRQQKQILKKKVGELEEKYRKSIKNYQDLLKRYQKQVYRNGQLKDQKDVLMDKYKIVNQQLYSFKKIGSSVEWENEHKSQHNSQKMLNKQYEQTEELMIVKKQLQQCQQSKNRWQKQCQQLKTKMFDISRTNEQQLRDMGSKIDHLNNQINERNTRITSIKIENQAKHQEIQKLTKLINTMKEQSHLNPINTIFKLTKSHQTQTQIITLVSKSIQKNDQTFLNQQDLVSQLIQKHIELDTLSITNKELQYIILQYKQKLNRQNSDPNFTSVKYRLQNQKLIQQIYIKDITIHNLQQIIKNNELENIKLNI